VEPQYPDWGAVHVDQSITAGAYGSAGIDLMTRSEFVRRLVLDSICDDFENVDQIILPDVAKTGAKCGLTIERSEVVDALSSLVADGLAEACILDPFSGKLQLPSMPPMDEVEEYFKTYFYITKKGMDLHLSDDEWWPLDDEGVLRKGWAVES
jgi:hypothetical protein